MSQSISFLRFHFDFTTHFFWLLPILNMIKHLLEILVKFYCHKIRTWFYKSSDQIVVQDDDFYLTWQPIKSVSFYRPSQIKLSNHAYIVLSVTFYGCTNISSWPLAFSNKFLYHDFCWVDNDALKMSFHIINLRSLRD